MKKTTDLFCLPFAGGNKYSYREFLDKSPSFLNIVTLEYPGRGGRMKDPLITDINELVNDIYGQIKPLINNNDYAIYGHSLGGLMSYLLTLKLIENNDKLPVHLFITGTTGPSAISRTEKKRHLLEKKEFVEEIRELNGMPEEILNNEELLFYFEPILRSDFKVSEEYVYQENPPLNIPVTVITGTGEDMELDDIQLWQKETTYAVDFKRMPGKHFFIFQHTFKIIEIISKKLYLHKAPY
ncbi:MAG: thioesterase domain-containing protein [Ferruginibacter sp.]